MNVQEILKKYNTEMQKYATAVLPAFNAYIRNESAVYGRIFEKLFNFYLFTSYLADSKFCLGNNLPDGITTLYSKACLSLYGIMICLKNGLASEAAILLRSLFETFITVEIILQKDSEDRLKLYNDYSYVERWNNLQRNKKLLSDGKIDQSTFNKTWSPEAIKQVEDSYNKVKANYHPRRPYHWTWKIFQGKLKSQNLSLRFICKELGYEVDYVKVYSNLSIAVHSSPLIRNILGDANRTTLAPLFFGWIEDIAYDTLYYASQIVEKMAKKYLDPETYKEIEIYVNETYFACEFGIGTM